MFKFFIGDEEVTCEQNIEINEEFMNPSSVILCKVYPKSWKGTNKLLSDYYYPDDYSKCTIYKDDELYFVGFAKNTANMVLNPFKPHYCDLQILDPTTLLSEGQTLEYVITNKNVSESILQVISSVSDYGFVPGNISISKEQDTIIGAYSTLDKTPYDVFQYLSLVSGTRWGTRMVNDKTIAIDFYSPELLEDSGVIECNTNYFKNNKIVDISYDYSTTNYRNKQIITSDEVFSNISQIEMFIANGYENSFMTSQKIGRIISITVDGIEKTFTTTENKELGLIADFYYTISSPGIETDTIYNSGSKISIEYIGIIKGREVVYNNTEISRIKENIGRNGTISRYENRNDVTSSFELRAIGTSYIKFNGVAEINLTIISKKDFLKLGGKYQFNAPLEKLCGSYLVKSKKTKIKQSSECVICEHEYVLSNNFDTENEINFFDNQRSKNNGNISQGDFIARNIDIENNIDIVFSGLKIEEIELSSSNVLDTQLDTPL